MHQQHCQLLQPLLQLSQFFRVEKAIGANTIMCKYYFTKRIVYTWNSLKLLNSESTTWLVTLYLQYLTVLTLVQITVKETRILFET